MLALLLAGASPAYAQAWAEHGRANAVLSETSNWSVAPIAGGPTRDPSTLDVVVAIRAASQRTGVDFQYLLAQAHLESSLNPDAQARTSSARGLYQFIESTWLASLERNGARFDLDGALRRAGFADGVNVRASRAALLELRSDPELTSLLAAAQALDNGAALEPVLGRAPTAAELYLAHFLGSGGAAHFLTRWQRTPQASAAVLFPREARANRAIFYGRDGHVRSLDAVLRAIANKVNGGIEATADLHDLARGAETIAQRMLVCFQVSQTIYSYALSVQQREEAGLIAVSSHLPQTGECSSNSVVPGLDGRASAFVDRFDINIADISYLGATSSNECEELPGATVVMLDSTSELANAMTTNPCDHTEMCYSQRMSTSIITRVRDLVDSGKMTRAGLARAAGLHANTLRDAAEDEWNPTADTLQKLEMFLDSNDQRPVLVGIEEIIDEARNGRMYILVDDEDRENEGDLIIPAQMATPQAINFMATHGRGLICLALTKDRVDHLGLQPMSRNNKESMQTAFTISIEAKEGVTTGISAADRARTISVAIDAAKGPDDLVTPGHVFPLMARDGGTLVRAGHTEAAVDISRLAGLNPSGVICEIMNDDGSMARLDDLIAFARKHDLKIGTIRDLIAYRMRNDHLVERLSERAFTSDYGGHWRMVTYRDRVAGNEAYVLQKGHVVPGEPTLARVHPISVFDDVLGAPGPRKRTLQRAMQAIGEHGAGVIVILTGRVGTGEWRPDEELRNIGIGSQILVDLGVSEMALLSNSRPDLVALEGYGLTITSHHPIPE